MESGESLERIRACADAAMAAMVRLGVAPSPQNFQIWYWHTAGGYPDLSRVLQGLETSGEPFTEARTAQIYERFFGMGHEAREISKTSRRIEQVLTQLQGQLGEASEGAARYGEALASFSDSLMHEDCITEIRELVGTIASESARMEEHAHKLENQLAETSRTIVTLRNDLALARREASVDGLTGIANRRTLECRLREEAVDSLEGGEPLSLLLADIDHFKNFNDNHGHQIGDQVIKLVARTLTQSIKGRDLAARYGGEEFAILLPRTELADAVTLGDQIRRTVASNRIVIRNKGRDLGHITLSIGAAEYRPGEPLHLLMQRTDRALYRAKREGRNRVVAAVSAPGDPGDDAGEPGGVAMEEIGPLTAGG